MIERQTSLPYTGGVITIELGYEPAKESEQSPYIADSLLRSAVALANQSVTELLSGMVRKLGEEGGMAAAGANFELEVLDHQIFLSLSMKAESGMHEGVLKAAAAHEIFPGFATHAVETITHDVYGDELEESGYGEVMMRQRMAKFLGVDLDEVFADGDPLVRSSSGPLH
jgi:hypothetical protein